MKVFAGLCPCTGLHSLDFDGPETEKDQLVLFSVRNDTDLGTQMRSAVIPRMNIGT